MNAQHAHPSELTPPAVLRLRADTRSRLLAEKAASLDEDELHRVFDPVVLPHVGIADAREARAAGATIYDVRRPRIVAAFYTSLWDTDAQGRGHAVTTDCVVDIDSGAVIANSAPEDESACVTLLDREFIVYNKQEFSVAFRQGASRVADLPAFRAHLYRTLSDADTANHQQDAELVSPAP